MYAQLDTASGDAKQAVQTRVDAATERVDKYTKRLQVPSLSDW